MFSYLGICLLIFLFFWCLCLFFSLCSLFWVPVCYLALRRLQNTLVVCCAAEVPFGGLGVGAGECCPGSDVR